METIFTLDARDNFYLELVKEQFNLSPVSLYKEIRNFFMECVSILKKKEINYQDLKNALVPQHDRSEIALVFDTAKIKSAWYGYEVFSEIIPLFDKSSSHSILCGDYIGADSYRYKLRNEFFSSINFANDIRNTDYYHHGQFFLVYMNNLSTTMIKSFHQNLNRFQPYVGYFDLTFESFIKTYFSSILVKSFIKSKNKIIQGHEDDVSENEDFNMNGYPFEENGYKCRSLQSIYYDLFLSYKIERKIFEGFEIDTEISINAINTNILDIKDCKVVIEENKLGYLHKEKLGSLKKAGVKSLTSSELEEFISEKISNNYIYNLSYSEEFETTKFNIIIDTISVDTEDPVRLVVALEYIPSDKILRLITLF